MTREQLAQHLYYVWCRGRNFPVPNNNWHKLDPMDRDSHYQQADWILRNMPQIRALQRHRAGETA